MPEMQTIEEMREAYKGEWALVVDYETDESGWVLRGRVVVHSPDRDDVYNAMADYHGGGAVEYFGDEDPTVMLFGAWEMELKPCAATSATQAPFPGGTAGVRP